MSSTLPVTQGVLRFAIGHPSGPSSNCWRIWTTKSGDVYIKCRDNYGEIKGSLHASNRWRFGFTDEALKNNPSLVKDGEDRAWEVWDRPSPIIPNAIVAFRLRFFTSELAITQEMRQTKGWTQQPIVFIEAAPNDGEDIVTVWITEGNPQLTYDKGPSVTLASLPLPEGWRVQVTVHGENEASAREWLENAVTEATRSVQEWGLKIPPTSRLLLFGHAADGGRFVAEANAFR